nr:hypothetical protein [Tanacetum cinerariifolium]
NDQEDEERCELFDDVTQELPICNIRRFEMIKYSFGDDEECVSVKEDEYEDLTNTSKEAIHAYREIFRMMDEGWMVMHIKQRKLKGKSLTERKVLHERQPRLLFIFIESVFLDINTAYPLHTIRRIECLDVISPLFLCTLNIIVSSVNTAYSCT